MVERVTIECEESYGVFDASRGSEPNNDNNPEPKAASEAARITSSSDVNSGRDDDRRKSPEYWEIPGTECLVKVCASAEGLGAVVPHGATLADVVELLRIVAGQAGNPRSEPVTLKADDIPSAA